MALMSALVKSVMESGADGIIIDIECHTSNSLPNIVIVGYANKAIDKAYQSVKERFSWEKNLTEQIDLYNSLIAK